MNKSKYNGMVVSDIAFSRFFWMWCDVTGNGHAWELCSFDGSGHIKFHSQDDFEDAEDEYFDYPAIPVEEPEPKEQ